MAAVVDDDFILRLKSLLIGNNGRMRDDDLSKWSRQNKIKDQYLQDSLQEYPEYFAREGNCVTLMTSMSICLEHCSKKGCQDDKCRNLHVCSFYLLSSCNNKEPVCRFGHDLQSLHNITALSYHLLYGLSDADIGALVRLNRSEATLPRVCSFYYGAQGCSKGPKCRYLHLCKAFILGSCNNGSNCTKSHNFGDQEVVNILSNFGLHGQPEAVLKNYLRTLLQKRQPKTNAKASADSVICVYALEKQQCKFGESRCRNVHSSKPYQWQYKGQDGKWINVPDNVNDHLQRAYVLPSNACCQDCPSGIKIGGTFVEVVVNFTSMRMIANGNSYTVRLVTTQSSARSFSRLATEWIWYWKDEYGNWNEYIARDGCNKVGISSKEIEDAYAQSTPQLGFSTESYEYEIDLQHMVQRNLSVGTERPVSRRPRLPLVGGRENSHLPSHWDKRHGSGNIAFVEVNRGCSEWSIIANLFEKTLPNESLKKVVRIQNEELWGSFCWKKKWMQKSLTDDEKLLFHGTKQEYIDRIAQEGFDWRNSGSSVGALFGEGSYFARDASYSKHYTDSRQLFVVRVLVGKTAQGKAHYRKPPSKYNSCVDNPSNPTIYVIFDFAQTYPEYLITY